MVGLERIPLGHPFPIQPLEELNALAPVASVPHISASGYMKDFKGYQRSLALQLRSPKGCVRHPKSQE